MSEINQNPSDNTTLAYAPRPAEQVRQRIIGQLATELGVQARQVSVTMDLLDDGATIPFIARYRKEVTGGLDDTVLRTLETRLQYLQELEARRDVILSSIAEQGKLTPALLSEINQADSKQRIEDLYAPYKPKRRTKAQIAREAGLQPLADELLVNENAVPAQLAQAYVNPDKGIETVKAALDGARDILVESFAETADLVDRLRKYLSVKGVLYSKVIEGKEQEGANFKDWFNFHEPLRTVPSHRMLAMLRGRQQGFLDLKVALPEEDEALVPHPCVRIIAEHFSLDKLLDDPQSSPRTQWVADVCRWTWKVKLSIQFEMEFITQLRERAETEAIRVFAANLKDLLLAPPAGPKAVLGLDPGIRTGVKVAAIDPTGKLLETATIYPFEPRKDVASSLATLARMAKQHRIELIAIGNGTASRETERLVAKLCEMHPELKLARVVVSEAGASVYSASELAAQEFPDLDVSLRGAVSIARRLQDPLAELVKIEPKAIGVGQYQHDVNQRELGRTLDAVVEDCVNAVGVDVNTASAPLLARISGLNQSLAKNIVQFRDANGAFRTRKDLMKVPRFGEKAFEQAAGFLRINNGDNPLDASAVHPEAYPVVEKILAKIQADIKAVMGNPAMLKGLSPSAFTDERFGLPTVTDIFAELEKPGRDPRPEFKTVKFEEGIETIDDLKVGMILEGVVTNVANFGAFVDIGVHQDGLVHISALSSKFIKDPRDVVRTGQTVKVKVIEIDKARNRIALTMRLDDDYQQPRRTSGSPSDRPQRPVKGQADPKQSNTAMAAAFAKLKR